MGNIPIVAAVETDGGSGGGVIVVKRMSDRTKIRISATVQCSYYR
jgi:hypothetical protein